MHNLVLHSLKDCVLDSITRLMSWLPTEQKEFNTFMLMIYSLFPVSPTLSTHNFETTVARMSVLP